MTNITLSIDDEVYKKMRKYSEIKWSEFVRRIIEKRVNEIEELDKEDWDNARFLGDEKLLCESWASKEDEKAFEYLQ
jgi:predicted CopG family antitoxin